MRRLYSTQAQSMASHYRLTSPTGVTIHECTIRSPLTGCQVTSRPHDQFSRYSKWLDTFRTSLVYGTHTENNSALSSLVVSMDERALQESKSNIAFVLRVGLFSFTASGIKSCTCNHRYNLALGEIRRFNP